MTAACDRGHKTGHNIISSRRQAYQSDVSVTKTKKSNKNRLRTHLLYAATAACLPLDCSALRHSNDSSKIHHFSRHFMDWFCQFLFNYQLQFITFVNFCKPLVSYWKSLRWILEHNQWSVQQAVSRYRYFTKPERLVFSDEHDSEM